MLVGSEKKYAIKIIQKIKIRERETFVRLLQNELKILAWVDHPNLIKIEDVLEDKHKFYVVSEILWGGPVINYIRRHSRVKESIAKTIIKQVMDGLYYLHSHNVVHRDIKLENLMFSSTEEGCFDVKLIDFGFAVKIQKNDKLKLVLGSPLYMAPELVKKEEYDHRVDIWALGVMTYALVCGKTPFDSNTV